MSNQLYPFKNFKFKFIFWGHNILFNISFSSVVVPMDVVDVAFYDAIPMNILFVE
jgi:hypothetical protein